jgi:hypothetical protein
MSIGVPIGNESAPPIKRPYVSRRRQVTGPEAMMQGYSALPNLWLGLLNTLYEDRTTGSPISDAIRLSAQKK